MDGDNVATKGSAERLSRCAQGEQKFASFVELVVGRVEGFVARVPDVASIDDVNTVNVGNNDNATRFCQR